MSLWQRELQSAFKTPEALLAYLGLDESQYSNEAHKNFKLLVPEAFAKRFQKNNPCCPLLRQVLPINEENQRVTGFSKAPLAEANFTQSKGLLHKYKSRVLITLSAGCAINCRYCFRRHFPYSENLIDNHAFYRIIDYIERHPDVTEVIVSGGDPLLVKNARLQVLIEQLSLIKHLTTLRFHTRIPVVLPSRIDDAFITMIKACRLKTVMVLHTNHPMELDEAVFQACQKMKSVFDAVLNQAVLLKGVNDSVNTLKALSLKLFEYGVMPYYLHSLDKVEGAAHFEVAREKERMLYQGLQAELPGYLVPKWVQEIPGEKNKTLQF